MTRFHHDNVLAVFVGGEGESLAQVHKRSLPSWVIRKANYVVGNIVRIQLVKEPLRLVLRAAKIYMDHDFRPRAIAPPGIDSIDAGVNIGCEMVPIIRQLPVRPQHAIGNLVADLHHVRQRAAVAQSRDRIARIGKDRLDSFRVRHRLPLFWRRLFAWVRPCAGVMKIQQKFVAKLLGRLRHG